MIDKNNDILSVSNSILAGSLCIALSIFLSGSMGNSFNSNAAVKTNTAPTNTTKLEVIPRIGAPREGNGKVTIVEFADFQCPYCQNFYNESYKQIKANYIDTGKVTLEYRHYPLSFHQNALKSAIASECANNQGKFWPYYETLFSKGEADGTGLGTSDLKTYAKDLGLDTKAFNTCLDDEETKDIVDKDMAAAVKLGVSGTPSFLVDGELIVGAQPFSVFQTAIEKALKQ